ncbi:hypothetical protein GE09DRAFT_1214559 [Coniochaeta sp. 2T2.1]|nr:hypothetical protein GE09DRAFT_1214559 [Coniochaeta sp. 2T2.1]
MAAHFGRKRPQEQIASTVKLGNRHTAKEVTWIFNFRFPDDPITEDSVKDLRRECQDETKAGGNEAQEDRFTQTEACISENQKEQCLTHTQVSEQQEDFHPSPPSRDQLSSHQRDQEQATDHDSFNLARNIETFWHNGMRANDRIDGNDQYADNGTSKFAPTVAPGKAIKSPWAFEGPSKATISDHNAFVDRVIKDLEAHSSKLGL